MILRSEMRERRRRNRGEDDVRGMVRGYEERVTYKTITRTEFQKRRASFESHEEGGGDVAAGKDRLKKKTRSLDELTAGKEDDPYHIQFQEKEMTEKLEDIHRMIVDMQEMTKRLKDRNYPREGMDEGKLHVKALGMSDTTEAEDGGVCEKSLLTSGPAPTVKPVRYRSTIVIAIGSHWKRFKEEIELVVDSRFPCSFADGLEGFH